MKQFRSLIPLVTEDNEISVRSIQPTNQSAHLLRAIGANCLTAKSLSHSISHDSFAYSSMNLANQNKQRFQRQKSPNFEDIEEIDIPYNDDINLNVPFNTDFNQSTISLSLPSMASLETPINVSNISGRYKPQLTSVLPAPSHPYNAYDHGLLNSLKINKLKPRPSISEVLPTPNYPYSQFYDNKLIQNENNCCYSPTNTNNTFNLNSNLDLNLALKLSYYSLDGTQNNNKNKFELINDDESDVDELELSNPYNSFNIFSLTDFKYMYQIGNGAYGIVDKSFHLPSCSIVAIKKCRSNNADAIRSFKKEVLICNEFADCKYIVNMIESGMDKDTAHNIYIALEYMNMSSLRNNMSLIRNDDVDGIINKIKYISFSVLSALSCLHSKFYIHNDIKPDNILINDDGEIKLSDFGCIQQMKDQETPLINKTCGTVKYQSYEKQFISPIKYTTKSDIYSFGITICELLDEQVTIMDNKSPFEITNNITSKYGDDDELIDFLNQCLNRDVAERWSADELLSHSFLDNINSDDKIIQINKIEDIDDLEFITAALSDYYLNYTYKLNILSPSLSHKSLNEMQMITPIDHKYTDNQRIQNIAKYTGCDIKYVHDFVFQYVNDIKKKYLKL